MESKTFHCNWCSAAWRAKGTTHCWSGGGTAPGQPGHCPAREHDAEIQDAFRIYTGDSDDARMARVAARVEGMCYVKGADSTTVQARWTRVEDTIAFARLMGYRKIGIATCLGLLEESERLVQILVAQDFEPQTVCCKAGSIDKEDLGLEDADKVRPGAFEPACNPIAQARLLGQAGSEMNIIVGLCVGHDMLFAKHSTVPVTTLVVKDRVTGHNPVSVLYGQNFYYKRLQAQPVVPAPAEGSGTAEGA